MEIKYNFDEIINRRGTNSVKWDLSENDEVLPMWVADMDFKTAPEILQAISDKVAHGIFGYSIIPDEFYESIISWWQNYHHFTIKKECLIPVPGMIVSLSALVRTFVQPGEHIILQPPVYNHFFKLAENCGYHIIENPLICENGNYHMDFEGLERIASDPKTTLLLLSNPHNPVGRAWTLQELEKLAEICSRNQVMVISDEIHADLVFDGNQHIPFASVAQEYEITSVTCGSPCKTFNISGLSISYIICEDQSILKKIQKTLDIQETNYPNSVAVDALIAAYTNGKDWLEQLKIYLYDNYQFLKNFCEAHIPQIKITPLQATYLVWLDCSFLSVPSEDLTKLLFEKGNIRINPGTMYGSAGEGFLRINIACPREILTEGLLKLATVLKEIHKP